MSSPSSGTISSSRTSYAGKLLLAALLGPLFLAGACQLGKGVTSLFAKGDNTFPESAVVQTAVWAKDSGRIYPALDTSPYTPAPYGPLFYLGLAVLAKAENINFDGLLVAGRAVSFAVYLLVLMAAYRWERRYMRAGIALLAPALILAQIDFVDWNVTVRPDLPAIGLTVAAFLFLTEKQMSWKHVIAAGVFCGLAGAVKQSFIALPIAAVLWLVWSRGVRWAAVFAVSAAAAGGIVVAILAAQHEPFLQEMLLARYSPTSAMGGLQLLKSDFLHYPLQIAIAGLAVMGLKWMPRHNQGDLRSLLILYFVLAWLVGFYTAMAPGANVNAFLEGWVVTALIAPFAVSPLAEHWSELYVAGRGLLIVMWLSLALVALEGWRVVLSVPPASSQRLAQLAVGRRVLTDFPYVAAHSSKPELMDPSVNHYLELARHWSSKPVLDEIENQEFDYVIVGESGGRPRSWRGLTLFSSSILRDVEKEYRLFCRADRFAVYVPGKRQLNPPADESAFQEAGCRPAARTQQLSAALF